MCILQHDAQRTTQICLFDFIDIDAVIADFSVLNIIKPVDQIRNCRFSGACRAYERNLLPRLREHFDIVQDNLLVRVAKVHIIEHHTALKTLIGCRVAVFVIMLPSPHSSVLLCLPERTIDFLCIDQHNIAIVCLRLFV